ncbi:rhamnan synthesis F family protein [Actinomyces faecalis]|uniref:rhamnan synthesis F family protein n=1 Tax=Actinomyces faecalis TaxID=2722820 RepID=UPI0015550AEB|nr:rhamnan synthesis F family protein [Actinomyces faecalis]
MRRTAIYLFHDPRGIVEDYVPLALRSLRPFASHLLVVVNGALTAAGRQSLEAVADEILVRENEGMDIGGYQAGLSQLGWEQIGSLDELVLVNNTFFAPVRPWEPVFEAAAVRPEASFWGLTEHDEIRPHPFLARRSMPRHLQSHFLAVRRPLLSSPDFRSYWQTMPPIHSYNDSVAWHESRFTPHFNSLGYESFAVFPLEAFSTPNPVMDEPEALLDAGCPALKRRVFFHDPAHLDARGVCGARLLRSAAQGGVEEDLLLAGLVRTTAPRTLLANAGLTEVLEPSPRVEALPACPRPVSVHAFLPSGGDPHALTSRLRDLRAGGSVVVCCADGEACHAMETSLRCNGVEQAEVRAARYPEGGSLLSLLRDAPEMTQEPVLLRLAEAGEDDPVGDPRLLDAALRLFEAHPGLGVLVRSAPVLGSRVLGHGWGEDRDEVATLARRAGIAVPLDDSTPVWSYGGSVLLRARGLSPLLGLDLTRLVREHGAGGAGALLALAEVSAVLETGLHHRQVVTAGTIAVDHALLEHRYQALAAVLPGDVEEQQRYLVARCGPQAGIGTMLRRQMEMAAPDLADRLKPAYRRLTGWLPGRG